MATDVAAEMMTLKYTPFLTPRQIAELPLPDGFSTDLGPDFVEGSIEEDVGGPYVSIEIAEDSDLLHVPEHVSVVGARDDADLDRTELAVAHASRFVVEEIIDSSVLRTSDTEAHLDWVSSNSWRFSPRIRDILREDAEAGDGLPVFHLSPREESAPDGGTNDESEDDSFIPVGAAPYRPAEPRVTDVQVEVTGAVLDHWSYDYPVIVVDHHVRYGVVFCANDRCSSLEVLNMERHQRTFMDASVHRAFITGWAMSRDGSFDEAPSPEPLEPYEIPDPDLA